MRIRPPVPALVAAMLVCWLPLGEIARATDATDARTTPTVTARAADSPTTNALADASATTPTLAGPRYPFLRDSRYEWEQLPSGVRIRDIHVGSGKHPAPGVAVYLNYRGYLEDGQLFTDTYADGAYLVFTYGRGEVIPGLEEGIATMKERGKRLIAIPPELAYGARGYQHPDEDKYVSVPPNATLVFDMTFLWIREPEWDRLGMFR